MISEGDKVFVNTKATADGMDTIFGHYMEVKDGKMSKFIAYDDTLSMFNAMKKWSYKNCWSIKKVSYLNV